METKYLFFIILIKSNTLNFEIILILKLQYVTDSKSINNLLVIFFTSH